MDKIEKPPIGLMPKQLHLKQRLEDIKLATKRYFDSSCEVPLKWIAEYNEILKQLSETPELRLRHKVSGLFGVFKRETNPTGKPKTTVIQLANGNEYYAPSHEFEEVE